MARRHDAHPYVSVFKPKGRARKSDPWLLGWREPETGRKMTRASGTNKGVAEAAAVKLSLEVVKRKAGLTENGAAPHLRWAGEDVALSVWGDRSRRVNGLRQHLEAQNDTPKHVQWTCRAVEAVLSQAGIRIHADLVSSATDVQSAVRTLPRRRGKGTVSNRTLDSYVRAMKTFGEYLRTSGRMPTDPFLDLAHFDPEATRVRYRFAMAPEILAKLIGAAEAEKRRHTCGLTGPQRAMLYRVAAGTGFRLDTCLSLERQMLRLDSDRPSIVVPAALMKSRKDKEQPIGRELATALLRYVRGLPREGLLFEMKPHARIVTALKRDLARAGVPYQVGKHFHDFHSLRHTYITNAVRAGGLAVAQGLAGHSTPALTMRYTHLQYSDYAATLERMAIPAAIPPADPQKGAAK